MLRGTAHVRLLNILRLMNGTYFSGRSNKDRKFFWENLRNGNAFLRKRNQVHHHDELIASQISFLLSVSEHPNKFKHVVWELALSENKLGLLSCHSALSINISHFEVLLVFLKMFSRDTVDTLLLLLLNNDGRRGEARNVVSMLR